MKTWTTLTTFVVSLMVIGFAGITPVHAGPFVVDKGKDKFWECIKNPKSPIGHCVQIITLKPLNDELNLQSTATKQNLETSNNRNAGVEPGDFSLTRQALMEMMFSSQIDEAFMDIVLLEPAAFPGGNFFLADKIEYFNFGNATGTNEPFGMREYFLFQFGPGIETMKTLETGKQ